MKLAAVTALRDQLQEHIAASAQVAAAVAAYGVFCGLAGSGLIVLLAGPVLLFQSLLWLKAGVWVKISLRMLHPRAADTGWIGLNMILDRLADAELAAAIVLVAGALFSLSLVGAWLFTCLPDTVDSRAAKPSG